MTILPLLRQDLDSVSSLQPEGWPDILPFMDHYTQSSYCIPYKVVMAGHMVGIGTGIVHGAVGWLGHIIVSPTSRNQGIGRMITQTLVDALQGQGCTTLYLVATDLGAPVYAKLGFETETEYLFFKDIVPDLLRPDPHVVNYRPEHFAQIVALDRRVSGEDRMIELEPHLQDGLIYEVGDTVEGVYLPTLGEGMIVAITPSAGIGLTKRRRALSSSVVFPIDNVHATQYWYSLGYKECRRAKRMRLGKARPWQPENLYGRIAGNIG